MICRYEENIDMLYEIAIRPVARGVYPLVPPTKEELSEIKKVTQKKAPGKYVPPHLRNKSGNVPGMSRSIPGLAPYCCSLTLIIVENLRNLRNPSQKLLNL